MSSHREAPEISQDPVADNTDVYAFRSPDNPNTVTIVANYLPGEAPAGGPNFYEFGEEILYEIHIDNDGDGEEDITYSFEFSNVTTNPNSNSPSAVPGELSARINSRNPAGLSASSPPTSNTASVIPAARLIASSRNSGTRRKPNRLDVVSRLRISFGVAFRMDLFRRED